MRLSVKLKALGCNVKRMVRYLAELAKEAARKAAASLLERDKRVWVPGNHAAYPIFRPTQNTMKVFGTTNDTPFAISKAA